MTGRALTTLVGAVPRHRAGKRQAVEVAPQFRDWARRHQAVLRDALRHQEEIVDLTDGMSRADLAALGAIEMDNGTLAHPLGDDELVRLLLMPRADALAIAAERRRRMQREEYSTREFAMNKHLTGLSEFHSQQRQRIKSRLASVERRRQRRDVGCTEDMEGIDQTTALSEPLSAFTVERRTS